MVVGPAGVHRIGPGFVFQDATLYSIAGKMQGEVREYCTVILCLTVQAGGDTVHHHDGAMHTIHRTPHQRRVRAWMCCDGSHAVGVWRNSYLNVVCRSLDRGWEVKNSLTRTTLLVLARWLVYLEYVLGG